MKTKNTNIGTFKRVLWLMPFVACCFIYQVGLAQAREKKEQGNQLKLVFQDKVGSQPLVVGNSYTNGFGETYTIQKFRFYITQLQIVDSSDMGVQYFPDSYFLIDAQDSASRVIEIPLSLKHVSYISFLLGVDSAANVSGTQEGALDPTNGMFWTWNSGYIMAKLQGKSPEAKSAGNAFSFDVGGFKPGENAARKIEFNINAVAGKNKTLHNIVIDADVNKWFSGVHDVKIAEHPGCHEPGMLAMQLADNYTTMFSTGQVSK